MRPGRYARTQPATPGNVRGSVNIAVALDLIYGPIFYRLIMALGAVDAAFVDALPGEVPLGIAA